MYSCNAFNASSKHAKHKRARLRAIVREQQRGTWQFPARVNDTAPAEQTEVY